LLLLVQARYLASQLSKEITPVKQVAKVRSFSSKQKLGNNQIQLQTSHELMKIYELNQVFIFHSHHRHHEHLIQVLIVAQ
jgi:hypothetical protein